MRTFKDHSQIQELGGIVLARVASTEAGANNIESEGALTLMLELLNRPKLNTDAISAFCTALLNVSAHSHFSLAKSGAVKCIIVFLRQHKSKSKAIDLAVLILHNLSFSQKVCAEILLEEEVKAIIEIMTAHPHRASVQASCCDALWALSLNSATAQATIISNGGVGAIISAVTSFNSKSCFLVKIYGYKAMANLAEHLHDSGDQLMGLLSLEIVTPRSGNAGSGTLVCCYLRMMKVLVENHPSQCCPQRVLDDACKYAASMCYSIRAILFCTSLITSVCARAHETAHLIRATYAIRCVFLTGLRVASSNDLLLQKVACDLSIVLKTTADPNLFTEVECGALDNAIDRGAIQGNFHIVRVGCYINLQFSRLLGADHEERRRALRSLVLSTTRYTHIPGVQETCLKGIWSYVEKQTMCPIVGPPERLLMVCLLICPIGGSNQSAALFCGSWCTCC